MTEKGMDKSGMDKPSIDKQGFVMICIAVVIIPLVHWLAPMFYSDTPHYVATEGGSIIGQGHNIYLQLLPYIVAYLIAPILLIWGVLRIKKPSN